MAREPAAGRPPAGRYQLDVPLDASKIEGFKPDQPVKVLVQGPKGPLASSIVKLDAKGAGSARFMLAERDNVQIILGPQDASDLELTGLQTVTVNVPASQWAERTTLKLPAIVIPPFYWWGWLQWCRTFVIHGRVVCADGSPVPGAQVCAFDVDWWWWWSSKQLIQCAVTDANGVFQMKFKWCCGWWPWWWWRSRFWQLEPILVERIMPLLQRAQMHTLIRPRPDPSVADLGRLSGEAAAFSAPATAGANFDPTVLSTLRDRLIKRLPAAPELEKLRLWPWWPWQPWADCAPDVIFQVTQECAGVSHGNSVIVNETIWDTRWNVPTTLNVTLQANENACCAPSTQPCAGGNCLTPTMVCDGVIANINGNVGAPVIPVPPAPSPTAFLGLQNPNAAAVYSDRPFAGAIAISGASDCMNGVDYYAFEYATSPGGPWNTMPPLANGAFTRTYLRFLPSAPWVDFQYPTFAASPPIDGHNVYETRQHYDATHPPHDWIWIGSSRDYLINWLTLNNFSDGVYYLRAKGWNLDAGGHLINERVLPLCGSNPPEDNHIVLRLDNRSSTAGPTDAHGNPCTSVHLCVDEPDTAIIAIRIVHPSGPPTLVAGCGDAHVGPGDKLEVDFVAYDPDGHLAQFDLEVHYNVNLASSLLGLSGAVLTAGPAWSGVPPADVATSNYLQAVTAGATRPTWHGGVFTLRVDATGPNGAFPYTCCYLLRLWSYKRTIVDCDHNHAHGNASETSFTILIP
jgi:hypothetical protein